MDGPSNILTMPSYLSLDLKLLCHVIIFIWIRAALPRYRFDQLTSLCWSYLLPVTFCHFIALVTAVIFSIIANIIYFLLLDRLVLSTVQRRSGPYIVGWFGLIQSIDDGIKLYIKRLVLPMKSHALIFISTPIVLLSTGLWTWSIMPYYQAGDFGYYTELS